MSTDRAVLVSVVIPTRNRGELLNRCLEALAAQTYRPLEVIVVDDGSSDGTKAALQAFSTRHPELAMTVLTNSPQRGANPSRNRGIAASRGQLVAFEDDDCVAEPTWVDALVRAFSSPRVGAVTGLVFDPEPKNIYDLAFRGTHLVYGTSEATRLVAGNMCVRRELLAGALDEDRAAVCRDTTVSGRGDEEGLFLRLKADGYEIRIAPEARVLHVHHYTRRSFYQQGWKSGAATARLAYKYGLPLRVELICLALGHVCLAAATVWPWSLVASLSCFGLFVAGALVYNEIWRKRKTVWQAVRVAPVLTAYYHVRCAAYLSQLARLMAGIDRLHRVAIAQGPVR